MKRSAHEAITASVPKRLRETDRDAYFDPIHKKRAVDVFQCELDDTGYLDLAVFMKWPSNAHRQYVVVNPVDEPRETQFQVIFSGRCSNYFDLLQFSIGDKFSLALRGSVIGQPESNRPTLLYEDGVVLRLTKNGNSGRIIDTWALDKLAEDQAITTPSDASAADWYATPATGVDRSSGSTEVLVDNGESNFLPSSRCLSPEIAPMNIGGITLGQRAPLVTASRHSPAAASITPGPLVANLRRSPFMEISSSDRRESCAEGSAAHTIPVKAAVGTLHLSVITAGDVQTRQDRPMNAINSIERTAYIKGDLLPKEKRTDEQIPSVPSKMVSASTLDGMSRKKMKKYEKNKSRRAKQAQKAVRGSGQDENILSAPVHVAQPVDIVQIEDSVDISDHVLLLGAQSAVPMSVPFSAPAANSIAHSHLQGAAITNIFTSDNAAPNPVDMQVGRSDTRSLSPRILPPQLPTHISVSAPPPSQQLASSSHLGSHSITLCESRTKTEQLTEELLRTGFHADCCFYTSLLAVQSKGKSYNVMGVVQSTGSIETTRTNEWKIRLHLVDPGVHVSGGFSVNCFGKTKDSLPTPCPGNILVIRQLQGDSHQGRPCGTAPSYKPWSWAIVDIRADEQMIPDNGVGKCRFQPDASEMRHCVRLNDWWKDTESNASVDQGTVHQIDSGTKRATSGRVHRTISEASPFVEPQGYFNCTVEVLYGHENYNQVYSLYVTDYTQNQNLIPVEREWCPPQLSKKILKLELFDGAALKGPSLKQGDYYFFGNVRMKVSSGGYWEASFSQTRSMNKLDEDNLEDEPHFAELLKRKVQWATEVKNIPDSFPHRLIEEVEADRMFCCTVEVLAVSPKDGYTLLYVTDYTACSELAPVAATITGSGDMQDRIVKISLAAGQAQTAASLEPGDFVSIKNLRLRPSSNTFKKLVGRLGGEQRLINKLQANNNKNDALQALLRRKEEWEARTKAKVKRSMQASRNHRKSRPAIESSTSIADHPKQQLNAGSLTSIKEVKTSEKCPNKFRIRARIVDFFPDHLVDFAARRCTKCGEDISSHYRICSRCDDAMDPEGNTNVRTLYQFWFRVEDEVGDELQVAVCDEECTLLKDLEAAGLREDEEALEEFTQRLRPLVGNLLAVHDGIPQRAAGEVLPPLDAPFLTMTIGSWPLVDEQDPHARGYVLIEHALAPE
ncbi:uncharacterized protein FIBRA_02021 [Fibroporia radiculosa]|uniref:Protection of telomeres protein 1 n=1 Tax=Fibroporia radiculosa TaxID=599839 RepID=J4I8U0_9APHY|nr:uncharacterized protein FIBRA_02021 [Fibroporia radiculosa]CCL99996.1 predicted protein [Fibroporia radiculosa]